MNTQSLQYPVPSSNLWSLVSDAFINFLPKQVVPWAIKLLAFLLVEDARLGRAIAGLVTQALVMMELGRMLHYTDMLLLVQGLLDIILLLCALLTPQPKAAATSFMSL